MTEVMAILAVGNAVAIILAIFGIIYILGNDDE